MPYTCDAVLCCLGCLAFFPGMRRRIINRCAFCPPRPPGYFVDSDVSKYINESIDIKKDGSCNRSNTYDGCNSNDIVSYIWNGVYMPLQNSYIHNSTRISFETVELKKADAHVIFAFYFTRPDARKTIIFSHGNATDIGIIHPHLLDLSQNLRCNVFGYEYTGYGCSTGNPSEASLYLDIEAAFEYLTTSRNINPSNIILYGQSMGSAPTIHLATRIKVGGVILHSGIKSGLSVLKNEVSSPPWFDAFKNVDKIKQVQSVVFVLHGTADTEVKIEHGKALHEAAPFTVTPWWVDRAGHNDIEIYWRSQYFARLNSFISNLDAPSSNSSKHCISSAENASNINNNNNRRSIAKLSSNRAALLSPSPPPVSYLWTLNEPKSLTAVAYSNIDTKHNLNNIDNIISDIKSDSQDKNINIRDCSCKDTTNKSEYKFRGCPSSGSSSSTSVCSSNSEKHRNNKKIINKNNKNSINNYSISQAGNENNSSIFFGRRKNGGWQTTGYTCLNSFVSTNDHLNSSSSSSSSICSSSSSSICSNSNGDCSYRRRAATAAGVGKRVTDSRWFELEECKEDDSCLQESFNRGMNLRDKQDTRTIHKHISNITGNGYSCHNSSSSSINNGGSNKNTCVIRTSNSSSNSGYSTSSRTNNHNGDGNSSIDAPYDLLKAASSPNLTSQSILLLPRTLHK